MKGSAGLKVVISSMPAGSGRSSRSKSCASNTAATTTPITRATSPAKIRLRSSSRCSVRVSSSWTSIGIGAPLRPRRDRRRRRSPRPRRRIRSRRPPASPATSGASQSSAIAATSIGSSTTASSTTASSTTASSTGASPAALAGLVVRAVVDDLADEDVVVRRGRLGYGAGRGYRSAGRGSAGGRLRLGQLRVDVHLEAALDVAQRRLDVLELALDLVDAELLARGVGRLLELTHAAAQRAAHLGQALGPEDEQGDHEDDDDLGGADVGHGGLSGTLTSANLREALPRTQRGRSARLAGRLARAGRYLGGYARGTVSKVARTAWTKRGGAQERPANDVR